MSLQELHIRALEDQVLNLTRDCHYLMSLLNTEDNIDWDSWEQGRKIKEDLERSKDFFDAIQRRQNAQNDYVRQRREEEAARIQRERNENARKAQEYLENARRMQEYLKRQAAKSKAKEELERSRVNTFSNVQKQKGMNYTLGDYISDIFKEFDTFRLFP